MVFSLRTLIVCTIFFIRILSQQSCSQQLTNSVRVFCSTSIDLAESDFASKITIRPEGKCQGPANIEFDGSGSFKMTLSNTKEIVVFRDGTVRQDGRLVATIPPIEPVDGRIYIAIFLPPSCGLLTEYTHVPPSADHGLEWWNILLIVGGVAFGIVGLGLCGWAAINYLVKKMCEAFLRA